MSEPRTPQVPMVDGNGEPFYPLTQYNQIVMPDGSRWNGEGGGAQIDDTSASGTKVYSSQKTQHELDQLSGQKAGKAGWTANKIIGTDVNGNLVAQDPPESGVDWGVIYPVGSIYMSLEDYCAPAAVIPGSNWERIEGRFLIGTGAPENNDDGTSPGSYNYPAESTGGEAEHVLMDGELPNISGEFTVRGVNGTHSAVLSSGGIFNVAAETSGTSTLTIDKTGSIDRVKMSFGNNEPHNNMPPYLAVYMWKRVPDEEVA